MTQDITSRTLGLLGLAKRAGKIIDGQERVIGAIASGAARLVVVAEDAGENGRKKLADKSTTYAVPCVIFAQKADLGRALGRQSVSACAVVDPSFANKLLERFGELHGGGAFDKSPSV